MKNIKKSTYLFSSLAIIWLALAGLTTLKLWSHEQLSQFIASLELIIQAVTLRFAFKVCSVSTKINKKIFIVFTIAIISLLVNDLSFYVIIYVFKISITNVPFLAFLSYYVPFLIWLAAASIFLIYILVPNILKGRIFLKILSTFFIFNLVVISLFFLSLRHDFSIFSGVDFSQAITCTYKLILFDLTMLCLICVEDVGMLLLLSGIAILISGDFLINYSSVAKTDTSLVYGELVWFLGLILMLLGMVSLNKSKTYEVKSYFRQTKAIKSRLILWTFSIAVLSFLIFFIFAYAFSLINSIVFSGLPFFIMIYSVLLVILSIIMGRYFEAPFKKLTYNIQMFTSEQNKINFDDDFTIEEFIFLQRFLLDSFIIREEKDRAKKMIADMALQVAHDTRSPAAAIMMIAEECNQLPEDTRVSLRDAAQRIEDIANRLMHQYLSGEAGDEQRSVLVSATLLSVLSEKRFQYKGTPIDFQCEFLPETCFVFIKVNLSEFKRVLSNLINNAAEALSGGRGTIKLQLFLENHEVVIKVIDHGKGMSSEKIKRVLSAKEITSDKEGGAGLGLTHTKKFLHQHQASFDIESTPGSGTSIILKFKKEPRPKWFVDEITLFTNDIIVVLDDDASIHGAWDQKLSNIMKQYSALSLQHFHDAETCINFIKTLSTAEKERLILLTDYELIKQGMNGLDVVESLDMIRSILVTSHYDDPKVIKKAILCNTRILPKRLAHEVHCKILEKPLVCNTSLVDLILLEDSKEFSDILQFLYSNRGKHLKAYCDPYDLMADIISLPKSVKICFDFELNLPVNGIELAQVFYKKGFCNLYLATGYKMDTTEAPPYLSILSGKMDLLNL